MLHMGPGQGVVVHDPSNMFYLTEGYTGEGMVYISAQKRVIITDFRYTEQAGRQAPGFMAVEISSGKNHNHWLSELVHADGVTELRVETNYLSVDTFGMLKDAVGEALNETMKEMHGIENFTDMICDETIAPTADDLETMMEWLTEKGHPALAMEPML